MKRIIITQKQLDECIKRLNEDNGNINLSTNNFTDTTLQGAVDICKTIASTTNKEVSFNGQKIDSSTDVTSKANEIKQQAKSAAALEESYIRNLKRNCKKFTKKNLL